MSRALLLLWLVSACADAQPAPEITTSFDKGYTDGIIAREGGMICFLNLAKMFKGSDLEDLAA